MNRQFASLVSTRTRQLLALAIACGVPLLAGCRIPPLQAPDAAAPVPDTFGGTTCPDNSARVSADQFFNDPKLTNLIQQALANNQDLKILAQDIAIANNEILFRRGAYLPFVSLRAGAGLDRSSKFTRDGAVDEQLTIDGRPIRNPLPDFLLAANVSWQVDIWRKLRNARDAAALRYLATAEGRNYVITRMVAEVADNYYALMSLDKRLENLDQTIKLQERSLELAKAKKEAGQGTELGVQRFQAEVRRNQSEKLIVQQEIIERENRINFLAGRFPQPVERSTAEFLDLSLPTVCVGVPSELLLNRPDIRQAERELEAAGLEVKVARAEFFPSLDITAGIGYRAFNPKFLFNPEALVGNVAGDLVAPLVNRRAIQAAYMTANARQLQALYEYQRTILDAFTEVINRVNQAENYRKSVEIKKQQLEALVTSVDVATKLFENARAEYIEVLFAQRDRLEAQMVLIETKRQQLSAVVYAYQALGGGGLISTPPQQTPPPPPQVPPQSLPPLPPGVVPPK
jgi:NodT family efflux transporter outer membrane factor (OMF) lipoprotein